MGKGDFQMSIRHVVTSWFDKGRSWLRLKKLEHELRRSEKFEKECIKIQCRILAEVEKEHQAAVRKEIQRLKNSPMFFR